MLTALVLSALILISGIESSSLKRDFKVYNGEIIISWDTNPFKFLVLLIGSRPCTGSLYNMNTVISAGHCFEKPDQRPNRVSIEYINRFKNSGIDIRIKSVFLPSRFMSMSGDDISVVKLKEEIKPEIHHHTALKPSTKFLSPGTEIILAGYGRDSGNNGQAGILRQGKAVIHWCMENPGDDRICAKSADNFQNQKYEDDEAGAPILTLQDNQYEMRGFYVGETDYIDGIKFMMIAIYTRHEPFIKRVAAWQSNVCKTM